MKNNEAHSYVLLVFCGFARRGGEVNQICVILIFVFMLQLCPSFEVLCPIPTYYSLTVVPMALTALQACQGGVPKQNPEREWASADAQKHHPTRTNCFSSSSTPQTSLVLCLHSPSHPHHPFHNKSLNALFPSSLPQAGIFFLRPKAHTNSSASPSYTRYGRWTRTRLELPLTSRPSRPRWW